MKGKILNGRPAFTRARTAQTRTKTVPGTEWFWLPRRLLQTEETVSNAYAQNAWAHAAIKLKARMCASVPLEILAGSRRDRDGEPVRGDDTLRRLMECPSPLMSGHEFIEATSIYLDLNGECFWIGYAADGSPLRRGEVPAEILIVRPDGMVPDIDQRTGIVLGWQTTNANGEVFRFTAEQVGHPKEFDPANPYRGLAPITPVLPSFNYELRATQFNNALLANGADPGGIIYSESPLTQDEATGLRSQWEDRHRGAIKSARLAILSGGLKYEPIAVTAKDMAFTEALGWGKSEILAVLGVTKFDLGEVEETNRASSLTAKANTWEKTILPRLRLIESTLWSWLLEPLSARLGRDVWAEFDVSEVEALQAPMTEKAQQAQILVAAGYSKEAVNVRLGLGIEEEPTFDLPELPTAGTPDVSTPTPAAPASVAETAMNGAQVTSLVQIVQSVANGELPAESAIVTLQIAFPTISAEEARALIEPAARAAAARPAPSEPVAPPAAPVAASVAQNPAQGVAHKSANMRGVRVGDRFTADGKTFRVVKAWNAKSRDASKVEKVLRVAMQKVFRQLRTEEVDAVAKFSDVLAPALAVNETRETEAVAETATKANDTVTLTTVTQRLQPQGVEFSWPPAFLEWAQSAPDRWEQRAREILGQIAPEIAEAALNEVRVAIGGFSVVNPADKEWVEEAGKRTASMMRVTRKAATRFNQIILTKIGTDGLANVTDLAKTIEATMGRFIVSDAMTIARTETGFIQEQFKNRAAKEEGFTHHEWSAASDARPSHQGQGSVRIGEKFPNGLLHPCEIGAPAEEVINCRCTAVPFVAREELGTEADIEEMNRLIAAGKL